MKYEQKNLWIQRIILTAVFIVAIILFITLRSNFNSFAELRESSSRYIALILVAIIVWTLIWIIFLFVFPPYSTYEYKQYEIIVYINFT